jgi:hypothetical protein
MSITQLVVLKEREKKNYFLYNKTKTKTFNLL